MHRNKQSEVPNFLRYPGGKRRTLKFLSRHLPSSASPQGRYLEPFVGSGAVFFMLDPRRALLSDINPDLIDLYRGIQQSPEEVWGRYCAFDSSKAEYQRVRDADPVDSLVDRAARVLFLSRTCFKGMWRHNKKGRFNVGYGGQGRRWAISRDDLMLVARALLSAELRCCDFEEAIEESEEGDFIFADPPYRPGEKEQINDHYVGQQFTFEDHRRLASALHRARQRGAKWALTTSAHPDVVALLDGNHTAVIPRGTGRRPGIMTDDSGEVLITSYPTRGEWTG